MFWKKSRCVTEVEEIAKTLLLNPGEVSLLDKMWKIAYERDCIDTYIHCVYKTLNTVENQQLRAVYCVHVGKKYLALGHIEYAIANFEYALQQDERHLPALEAMSDLFRETGNHRALLEVLKRRLNLSTVFGTSQEMVDEIASLRELLRGTDEE
jgi:tetratricopeptide (TPR) repeat protein